MTVAASIQEILSHHVSSITLRSVIHRLGPVRSARVATLQEHERQHIVGHLQWTLEIFAVQNKAMLLSRYRQYLEQSHGYPSNFNPARAAGNMEVA